eukprot:2374042-Amphidinium_carterae.3
MSGHLPAGVRKQYLAMLPADDASAKEKRSWGWERETFLLSFLLECQTEHSYSRDFLFNQHLPPESEVEIESNA